MTLTDLKALHALLLPATYDDETFSGILPYVQAYIASQPRLRSLPLGEVPVATTLLADGTR